MRALYIRLAFLVLTAVIGCAAAAAHPLDLAYPVGAADVASARR
jgi:hypothetical protein